MDLKLSGRTAVVSGGSKGIGFAIAQALLAEGCKVMICARTAHTLEDARERLEAQAPGRVAAKAADMTAPEAVRAVVAEAERRLGPVDIAVSNVIGHVIEPDKAGAHAGHFIEVAPEDYRTEFDNLLMPAWYLAREVMPGMKARGFGRILNIGSGVAREPAWELPHMLPNTVRPAVAGLYRSLAERLAPFGVTVNNVLTGSIATERNAAYFSWLAEQRGVSVEEVTRPMYAGQPVPRPGRPEEMAGLVVFLCSAQAAPINGQSLHVNGGRTRHIY